MLEELPTFALSTDEFAAREDTSPKELIEVKLEDVPGGGRGGFVYGY